MNSSKRIISLLWRKKAKNKSGASQHIQAQSCPQAKETEPPGVPERRDLCERCILIFATADNLRSLVSSQGLTYYGPQELDEHAEAGCRMCRLLRYKFTPDRPVGTLYLQGLTRDVPKATTQHPSHIRSMGHLSIKWNTIEIRIQGYTDDPVFSHIEIDPLSYDTGSAFVARRYKKALQECLEHHECGSRHFSTLPSRVIDVGLEDGSIEPKLYVSDSIEKVPYTTLSYCWGDIGQLTRTNATLEKHRHCMPMNTLSLSVQDAITVTRHLGIRYLWVDALCIIQDCPTDVAREINKMGDIYSNCTVTIAATRSMRAADGFLEKYFFDQPGRPTENRYTMRGAAEPEPAGRFFLPILLADGTFGNISMSKSPPREWDRGHLESRGWTLQEFLLSKRLLVFGHDGDVRWHCLRTPGFNSVLFPSHSEETKSINSSLFFLHAAISGRGERVWSDIINEYSGRKLTVIEDRLLAIAGIAAELNKQWKYSYVAGMWVEKLQQDIMWEILDEGVEIYPVSQQYIAPSWSWASVNKQVICPYNDRRWVAQILSCYVVLTDPGVPFGQVKEGVLSIRGETCPESRATEGDFSGPNYYTKLDNMLSGTSSLNILLRVTHKTKGSKGTSHIGSSGFILQPVEDGKFRRVGVFSYDARTFSWDPQRQTPTNKTDWTTQVVIIV